MNLFYKNLIVIILCMFCVNCASRNLKIKNRLHNCKVESFAKDDVINKLYDRIKKLKSQIHISKERESHQIIKLKSRVKLCRKNFLDCKVAKSNLKDRNSVLRRVINSN